VKHLKLVAIVGPTASGKSALAVELAKKFGGIIISADSRQIYRGMNVGTTKISRGEMKGISHYMLDVAEPGDDFNVALYQKSVFNLLKHIEQKNKKLKKTIIPFVVGGTGLYVSAIADGLQFPSAPPNPALRARLDKLPLENLAKDLLKLDSDSQVDAKNKQRVIRAIEILKSGQTQPTKIKSPFDVLKIGLGKNREEIKRRITARVRRMDIPALVKETKRLIKKKYDFNCPALSALGYKDVRDFINKKIAQEELLRKLIKLHTNYAKRQMTWFKRDKKIRWIKTPRQAEKLIREFLS